MKVLATILGTLTVVVSMTMAQAQTPGNVDQKLDRNYEAILDVLDAVGSGGTRRPGRRPGNQPALPSACSLEVEVSSNNIVFKYGEVTIARGEAIPGAAIAMTTAGLCKIVEAVQCDGATVRESVNGQCYNGDQAYLEARFYTLNIRGQRIFKTVPFTDYNRSAAEEQGALMAQLQKAGLCK
jgi:hypothetical protein